MIAAAYAVVTAAPSRSRDCAGGGRVELQQHLPGVTAQPLKGCSPVGRCGAGVPDSWPRSTGRTTPADPMPADLRFAFADVDGAPSGTIGMTAIEVGVADGRVLAELPDGTRLPFAEFFSFFLSISVVMRGRASPMAHTHRGSPSAG